MQPQNNELLGKTRQKLLKLHQDIGQLLQVFLAPKPITKGSVYRLQRKCGKPGCRCAQGELHSSMAISWSDEGKTKLISVPRGRLVELRSLTKRYQQFRRARARVVKLQQEMIELIDRLEAARSRKV